MAAATHHPVDDPICQVPAQEAQKEEAAMNNEAIPLPPGLRGARLSVEAAEEIERILEDPDHSTHAGKEMPTADASVLLKKKH